MTNITLLNESININCKSKVTGYLSFSFTTAYNYAYVHFGASTSSLGTQRSSKSSNFTDEISRMHPSFPSDTELTSVSKSLSVMAWFRIFSRAEARRDAFFKSLSTRVTRLNSVIISRSCGSLMSDSSIDALGMSPA